MPGEVLLPAQPKRILLPRFDTLGDIVLFEGFVEALLRRFPEATVILLIRRVYADLACLFPPGLEWLVTEIDPSRQSPSKPLCAKLAEDMRDASPDLVLVTAHNHTWADDFVAAKAKDAKSLAIGRWMQLPSADKRVLEELGLSAACPYAQTIPVSEDSHEIEKYQVLWQALTGDSALPEPRLNVNEHQRLAADKILQSMGLQNKRFCLCFPAGTQKVAIKTWPQDRFAETIAWLELERNVPSLVAGHRSEAIRIEEVTRLAGEKGASPKIWLGRDGEIPLLAALLEAAKLYLGNDTGPMHMAAALKTPVIAIFGGGTWPRFIPRGENSIALAGEMPCFGCGWDCIFGDAPCMELVTVGDAKKATDELLGTSFTSGPRIFRASIKLSHDSYSYIRKAFRIHREINQDRLARLDANVRQAELLEASEADRAARLVEIERLGQQLATSEADRAARLVEIERLGQQLITSEQDRATCHSQIQVLQSVRNSFLVRGLIRSGLVKEKKGSK